MSWTGHPTAKARASRLHAVRHRHPFWPGQRLIQAARPIWSRRLGRIIHKSEIIAHHIGAHVFSFWDALLVQTAPRAGCMMLLTEDLQDGRRFDGLVVRNLFRSGHDS